MGDVYLLARTRDGGKKMPTLILSWTIIGSVLALIYAAFFMSIDSYLAGKLWADPVIHLLIIFLWPVMIVVFIWQHRPHASSKRMR